MIYTYIYIYRERERESAHKSSTVCGRQKRPIVETKETYFIHTQKRKTNHHPVAQKCAEFLDGLEKAREHFAAHFRHHHAPRLAPGPKKKYFQRYIKTFAAHYCYHHATRLALGPDVCERERERERERGRERERERERT